MSTPDPWATDTETVDTDVEITSSGGPWAMVPAWILTLKHQDAPLSGADLRAYIAIRSFANRGGDCHPKITTLAERAGVHPRTLKASLAKFSDLNLIEITHQHREDGSLRSSKYHLTDVNPVQRDHEDEDNWRAADRALFEKIVGPYVESDGTYYRAGRFASSAFYNEFHKRNIRSQKKVLNWPGRFVNSLDESAMERWLEEEGIALD